MGKPDRLIDPLRPRTPEGDDFARRYRLRSILHEIIAWAVWLFLWGLLYLALGLWYHDFFLPFGIGGTAAGAAAVIVCHVVLVWKVYRPGDQSTGK